MLRSRVAQVERRAPVNWHMWVDSILLAAMIVLTVVDSVVTRRKSRREHKEWMAALKDKYEGRK